MDIADNQLTQSNLLMVFVKNPLVGRVKTRLASSLGSPRALSIYKQLLAHTRLITHDLNCDLDIWYDAFIPEEDEWDFDGIKHQKNLQQGKDTGKRLQNAFSDAFDRQYNKVVVIGSDSAEITGKNVNEAFESLEDSDAVIGPAMDGGYYLLGLNYMVPELFAGKDWETATVYDQTIKELHGQGLNVAELPVLQNIDTTDDWFDLLSGKPIYQQR